MILGYHGPIVRAKYLPQPLAPFSFPLLAHLPAVLGFANSLHVMNGFMFMCAPLCPQCASALQIKSPALVSPRGGVTDS